MSFLHKYFLLAVAALALVCLPGQAGAVLLTDGGQPRAVIVTADTPNAATADAVAELNYWLTQVAGTALPVKTFSQWDGQGTFVAVGESPLTQAKGWSEGPFAQEEARVFITDEGVGLLGNDNSPFPGVQWSGTYYAVLEFLQKELGARWIWPGASGEVFEVQERIDPQPAQWTWAPDLTLIRMLRNGYSDTVGFGRSSLRGMKDNFGITVDPQQWAQINEAHEQWLKRQRMNRSSNARFGHAFSKWWENYNTQHPDWFARPPEGLTQHGGHGVKLNLSNPEVSDKIFADWYAGWQKNKIANRYLNVAPNDSRGFDTRPETRAMDAPQMQGLPDKEIYNGADAVLTDRYVKFWNGLARRVSEVDPEARLATYAYRNYREPPLEAGLMVEPNIVVAYVGGEGYYPDEPFIRTEWDSWASRGASLSWRPNLLHAGHGIPYEFSRELFDDFAFFRERNLLGTDFDSLLGNWSGQGLSYYILAEQHSRPQATYDELANEYFAAFGPAAQSIREFYDYFAARTRLAPDMLREPGMVPRMTWGGWWIGHMRIVPEFMSPEAVAEGWKLLNQAEAAAANASPAVRERVAMMRLGFTHAELMAKAFRELNVQDPNARIRPEQAREVLQPLWDFRMANLADIAMPVTRYFFLEQRNLQLWNAFRATEAPLAAPRHRTMLLSEGWLLRPDNANVGISRQWQREGANASRADWQPVQVGQPWRKSLPKLPETKVVWYLLPFEVPELADTGEIVRLRFGSVDAETRLWINGVQVDERNYPHGGNYDSWAESFDVDVTSAVRGGGQNILVIRVESDRPNGGITGPVSLLIGN